MRSVSIRGPAGGTLACALGLLGLLACEGRNGLSGTYTRTLYGEGELRMSMRGNTLAMELPSPRWPAEVDIEGPFRMRGDTLIFDDAAEALGCKAPDARYLVRRQEDTLNISGLGMDPCGARHAALVGTWTKS
ncbi:MAG TPA: hypothetical protein VNK43_11865 [Gemmatimonadales bacterium]|nr:hypothetical protein [Gemmatimonadales bacterium]